MLHEQQEPKCTIKSFIGRDERAYRFIHGPANTLNVVIYKSAVTHNHHGPATHTHRMLDNKHTTAASGELESLLNCGTKDTLLVLHLKKSQCAFGNLIIQSYFLPLDYVSSRCWIAVCPSERPDRSYWSSGRSQWELVLLNSIKKYFWRNNCTNSVP